MLLLKILAYLVLGAVPLAILGWFIGLCIGGQHVQSTATGIGAGVGVLIGLGFGVKKRFA